MEKLLKKFLFEIPLSKIGKVISRITKKSQLESLIRSLHPIDSGYPLIRLGPNDDGGYLIPSDLEGIEACFSPGVSSVTGFENDLANLGIKVFLADKSVDNPSDTNALFSFKKKFIGSFSDEDFLSIEEWVNSSNISENGDLILQMDIESFEYETIFSMSEKLIKRFRIIIIEFHQLDRIHEAPFFFIVDRVFKKILNTHACVHAHPNNITGTTSINNIEIVNTMEFTFFRKDRFKDNNIFITNFPHPLDADNCSFRQPLVLPKNWYRGE